MKRDAIAAFTGVALAFALWAGAGGIFLTLGTKAHAADLDFDAIRDPAQQFNFIAGGPLADTMLAFLYVIGSAVAFIAIIGWLAICCGRDQASSKWAR